ncbi:MAG TPA: ATP-binding cassette domain-containing protein, partial [Geminicoccaceae bacterium]|nr:ATP-binding cassette domain-containing protein [Geminicoccaceae bacterium]
VPAKDRDIAMVFQSYALYPHMRVRDNLAFGLRRRGFPKAEIEARVERAAAMLGLTPYLDRRPHALSGGQRQRVALGRAVVRDPKVFLFDEPLSNLDAALRVSTRNELIRQHQRLGATMIYVTHDQVEAMTMGTRICIMNGGRVVQLGPPLEVYRDPADTFVARFLGNPPMNLVPAAVSRDGDGPAARLGARTLPLRGWSPAALPTSEPILGIRPEDLYEVRPAGIAGPFALVPARVDAVEPLGAETLLVVTLEGTGEEVTARVGRDSRARPGDLLELHLDLSAVHLFDPATARAIPPDDRSIRAREPATWQTTRS